MYRNHRILIDAKYHQTQHCSLTRWYIILQSAADNWTCLITQQSIIFGSTFIRSFPLRSNEYCILLMCGISYFAHPVEINVCYYFSTNKTQRNVLFLCSYSAKQWDKLWTNRMARHGSERSLHSLQSMHPGFSPRVNNTNEASAMELAPSPSATCTDDSTFKVNADSSVVCTTRTATGTVPSPSIPSISSPWESRIPRPSPTGLRRSVSMRMRGERISPHQPPPLPSTVATAALARQHQQHRRLNFLQHQQHHHLDHRIFPVITENGTESPRQRSLVSIVTHIPVNNTLFTSLGK